MILRITVPDEVYEAYGQVNPKNPRKVMEDLLVKFAGADPEKKSILVTGDELAALQKILGTSVDSSKGLLEAVRGRLTFEVGGVRVELTEAQRKKLVTQAQAWKKEPTTFIEQQVTDLLRSL